MPMHVAVERRRRGGSEGVCLKSANEGTNSRGATCAPSFSPRAAFGKLSVTIRFHVCEPEFYVRAPGGDGDPCQYRVVDR